MLSSRCGGNHDHLMGCALCQVHWARPSLCSPLKVVSSHPHSSVNPYFSVIQRFSQSHTTYCEIACTLSRGTTNNLYSCIFSDFLRFYLSEAWCSFKTTRQVAKKGLGYSWEMVSVEVSEEFIRMGFIQTECLIPCRTALCQIESSDTSEAATGAAVSQCWKLLPKS